MRNKITIGAVVTTLLLVIIIVLAIVMVNTNNNLNKQIDDLRTEKVLTAEDFQVGGIDLTTGKLDSEDEFAFMTQNYHKLDGAKIEFDNEDTTVEYRVFFYDNDKKLLGKTDALKVDYALTAPADTVYFRVMVDTDETKATVDNAETLLAPLTITVQKK